MFWNFEGGGPKPRGFARAGGTPLAREFAEGFVVGEPVAGSLVATDPRKLSGALNLRPRDEGKRSRILPPHVVERTESGPNLASGTKPPGGGVSHLGVSYIYALVFRASVS